MAQPMTPSAITDGQIDKAVEVVSSRFRKQLRDHRDELSSDAVQIVLGQNDLADELFADFLKRVEAIRNTLVRRVKVDRSLDPGAMLDATGRRQCTDEKVVKSMPKGEGEMANVHFFQVGCNVSDENLEKEYASRGLIPADPYSLAAVNRDDRSFADECPNGTHWKDAGGKWCFAMFYQWRGERRVRVDRDYDGWFDPCWFAGVPAPKA